MMKTIKILLLILSMRFSAEAQGVHFEREASWSEIMETARKENKYVMVDCYTTWCGPCKKMDQETFSDPEVGAAVKEKFIAVKLQMDKTIADRENVKSRYKDAEMLEARYGIRSYPSVLFFSPDGMLVYRTGYQEADSLLATLKTAADPTKNISGMMEMFDRHEMPLSQIRKFMDILRNAGENANAMKVARFYEKEYIDKLPTDSLLSKQIVSFYSFYPGVINSTDRFFKIVYSNGKAVDSVFGSSPFSSRIVEYIIINEEINSKIWENEKPRDIIPAWNEYEASIAKKYNTKLARQIVLQAKVIWYNEKKDWPQTIKYFIEKTQLEGISEFPLMQEGLNTDIYEVIFIHGNDPAVLQKGIDWMEELLKKMPDRYQWIDTYASLLYKKGNKAEGIKWEKKALQLATEKKDTKNVEFFQSVINKMEKNEPIW